MQLLKLYWLSEIGKSISDAGLTLQDHILLRMNYLLDMMILDQEVQPTVNDIIKAKQDIEDWKAHIEQIL